MLLQLPFDVRSILYHHVLVHNQSVHNNNNQPSNHHLRLLHSCRTIYYEAIHFRTYVSLRNEFQIQRFHRYISSSPESALSVRWADVANDGRTVETLHTTHTTPASQLYRVLAKLICLEKLRVFDVCHYHPFTVNVPQLRYHLDFEGAMYPHTESATLPCLSSYELYLNPSTRATLFDRLPSGRVHVLRLSGDCHLNPDTSFPALRHLTIRSVTSNTFDKLRFNTAFLGSPLDSFTYAQGHRMGFEIRNDHLLSLVDGSGHRLQRLVLLGCACLTTSAIASCLRNLPALDYFALSFMPEEEQRENFVLAIGPSLRTFKLHVTRAWYAMPVFDDDRVICNSLEEWFLTPASPLDAIYVSFPSSLMAEDGRAERWKRIADARHLTLKIGPWEEET